MERLSSTPDLSIPKDEEELAEREAAFDAAVRDLGGKPMPEALYDECRLLSMVHRAYDFNLLHQDLEGHSLDEIIKIVGIVSGLQAMNPIRDNTYRFVRSIRGAIDLMQLQLPLDDEDMKPEAVDLIRKDCDAAERLHEEGKLDEYRDKKVAILDGKVVGTGLFEPSVLRFVVSQRYRVHPERVVIVYIDRDGGFRWQ